VSNLKRTASCLEPADFALSIESSSWLHVSRTRSEVTRIPREVLLTVTVNTELKLKARGRAAFIIWALSDLRRV
jgi:hypothetical protein